MQPKRSPFARRCLLIVVALCCLPFSVDNKGLDQSHVRPRVAEMCGQGGWCCQEEYSLCDSGSGSYENHKYREFDGC